MNILLTGGAGYIGSHTAVELLASGHKVVIIDNLSNSSKESIERIKNITESSVPFYEADLRNHDVLDAIFTEHAVDAVIHFAGLKAVGESVSEPLSYYDNNIISSLTLLSVMQRHRVRKLVFSSSATVYGTPSHLPLTEESPTGIGITNPYGWTKYIIEQILRDTAKANPSWEISILRYFNPVGAHPSGLIGEDPRGVPNNLLPFVSQVAVGKLEQVSVFGDDYKTPDGTCLRDYIHVVDLANGHLAAINHLKQGVSIYNLGTGRGTSVFEVIEAFRKASGEEIPYAVMPRRPGDIEASYATVDRANAELEWKATRTIVDACRDSWKWQSMNPDGYGKESTMS